MSSAFDSSSAAQTALRHIEAHRERVQAYALQHGAPTHRDGATEYLLAHLELQGGGTLGVAHLGFLRGLEHGHVRFAGLAGTSAGAIVTLLVAAARRGHVSHAVAGDLLPILQAIPAVTFMDGPYRARRLIKTALAGRFKFTLELLLPVLWSTRRLIARRGLHAGVRFHEWLARILRNRFDIGDAADLHASLKTAWTEIADRAANPCHAALDRKLWRTSLQIAATAMPLGVKVVFPQHSGLFSAKYACGSPALMARASMSIPFFFEPLQLDLDAQSWSTFVRNQLLDKYPDAFVESAARLRSLSFVDGGLLSNFPIDAFASVPFAAPELRKIPTIGVALVPERPRGTPRRARGMREFLQFCGGMVEAMRHMRDRESLQRGASPGGGAMHVAFVDTGEHNWLNFALDQSELEDLYVRGLQAADAFLQRL